MSPSSMDGGETGTASRGRAIAGYGPDQSPRGLAWYRAFRRRDVILPVWQIHRHIGMGGDRLVPAMTSEAFDATYGDEMRDAWTEEFATMLDEVAPLPGVEELLATLRDCGFRLVRASSGKPEHVDRYLDLINGRSYAEAWTTSEDVAATKPAPDLVVVAALRRRMETLPVG